MQLLIGDTALTTGNAATDIEIPRKSAKLVNLIPSGANSGYSESEAHAPRRKGTMMLACDMEASHARSVFSTLRSSSSPTRKHVKDYPELRDHSRKTVLLRNPGEGNGTRPERIAQKRRSQQNAADHLADNRKQGR